MALRLFICVILVLFLTACNLPQAPADPAQPIAAEPSPPIAVPELVDSVAPTESTTPTAPVVACIPGGSQKEINDHLRHPGDEAVLCQGALFELNGPVRFTATDQKLYTVGNPTDSRRAVLRVVGATLTSAVVMRDNDKAMLSYVIIDGNRNNLGYRAGEALVYAGGSSDGQMIRYVKLIEPRSWSALHLIQGHPSPEPPCRNALVEFNEIGPAGQSNETWADGISLACTNTTVRNNQITDATDGAIVIFGAPGSVIENNLIRAETRTLLGGINMVDYGAYDGNYTGTIVRNNIIWASGAVIRIGFGMGPRVWGCFPVSHLEDTIYGGKVTGNVLRGEKMQYGFIADGVRDWTVLDNRSEAVHAGRPAVDCRGRVASPPAAFQYYQQRAQGVFQAEFQQSFLELALWAIRSPLPGE
jgi:hypothetical protein